MQHCDACRITPTNLTQIITFAKRVNERALQTILQAKTLVTQALTSIPSYLYKLAKEDQDQDVYIHLDYIRNNKPAPIRR